MDPVEEGHSKLLCWLGNGGPAAPALRRQRRVDLCEFKTSQPGQPGDPVSKIVIRLEDKHLYSPITVKFKMHMNCKQIAFF